MGEYFIAHVVLYPSNEKPERGKACSSTVSTMPIISFVLGDRNTVVKAKFLSLNSHGFGCYGLSLPALIWITTACHFAEAQECEELLRNMCLGGGRGFDWCINACLSECLTTWSRNKNMLFFFVKDCFSPLTLYFWLLLLWLCVNDPSFTFLSNIWNYCQCFVDEQAWLKNLEGSLKSLPFHAAESKLHFSKPHFTHLTEGLR